MILRKSFLAISLLLISCSSIPTKPQCAETIILNSTAVWDEEDDAMVARAAGQCPSRTGYPCLNTIVKTGEFTYQADCRDP